MSGYDETYVYDTLDRLDNFLSLPGEAAKRYREAVERYEVAVARAGAKGFDYERAGKLGCRVIGSGCGDHDPLIDVVEAREMMDDAKDAYDATIRIFEHTVDQTGMTSLQKDIVKKRFESEKPVPFGVVAYELGIDKYETVRYQCNRGCRILAVYLSAEARKNEILKGACA